MADRPRVVLELEDCGDAVPFEVRLRATLKTMLRRDRIRCTRATYAEQHQAEGPRPQDPPPEGPIPG